MYLSFSSDTHAQPLTEAYVQACMSIHWSSYHVLVSGDAEVPLYSYYLSSKQQMCWSDCADAQADLYLCCLHMQSAGYLKTRLKLLLITFFRLRNEWYFNVFYMHVSILIEGFNANKTYKISVLLPSENQTSYLYT